MLTRARVTILVQFFLKALVNPWCSIWPTLQSKLGYVGNMWVISDHSSYVLWKIKHICGNCRQDPEFTTSLRYYSAPASPLIYIILFVYLFVCLCRIVPIYPYLSIYNYFFFFFIYSFRMENLTPRTTTNVFTFLEKVRGTVSRTVHFLKWALTKSFPMSVSDFTYYDLVD